MQGGVLDIVFNKDVLNEYTIAEHLGNTKGYKEGGWEMSMLIKGNGGFSW